MFLLDVFEVFSKLTINQVVATPTFCLFTPKIGEMMESDSYFSNGLVQPPTR